MSASRTRRGALGGAAAAALALGAAARAGGPSGVERLERQLASEQRLEAAYRAALDRDAIDAALGALLLSHEREHVRGVELALETLGRRRPRASVPAPADARALAGRESFARFALGLEGKLRLAYVDTLSELRAPELLQPLGSIMACGAQHEVALRHELGQSLL
jgi:hypothetical protein